MTLLHAMSISVIMFAPYCYKQLAVKCDYVLKQLSANTLIAEVHLTAK